LAGCRKAACRWKVVKVARSEGNVRARPLGANAVANGGRKAKSMR
jgi:hypothetical protein